MKAESISENRRQSFATAGAQAGSLVGQFQTGAYLELTKPRITLLVLITTAAGFYLGSSTALDWRLLFHVLVGTALVASGSAALNQFLERETDSRMKRTCERPLPSGRVDPGPALLFSLLLVILGGLYLGFLTSGVTSALALVTVFLYTILYTPLKRRTNLCTTVGAFPGAIPPLIGWAAAAGSLDWNAGVLFAILFFWQFPHFLAIGWLYKPDYERAGLIMLPKGDITGRKTGAWILFFTGLLVFASILPWIMEFASSWYLAGAALLGILFLGVAAPALGGLSSHSSKRLLKASVIYLPLLLLFLILDRSLMGAG